MIGTTSILAALDLSDRVKADILARMTAPARHYHSMGHLELLWARHERYASSAPPFLRDFAKDIALAIAFHDIVYIGGARDNEMRSAEHWLSISGTYSLDHHRRMWIAQTIRATADHLSSSSSLDLSVPSDYARQWVLDLDLTPLGEPAAVFDANMDLLRAEDPEADLAAAIAHFASTASLYRCPPIAAAFAEPARANFARHLRR